MAQKPACPVIVEEDHAQRDRAMSGTDRLAVIEWCLDSIMMFLPKRYVVFF